MVGGGRGAFIGAVHRIAAAMDQQIDLVCGAFSSDPERSKASGEWQPQTAPNTIADGLLTSTGELTWPIIRDLVNDVFTVTVNCSRHSLHWYTPGRCALPSRLVSLS